ncbi:hypothetical protein HOLleu_43670 [Holothuria leucospilota]|uniref:Uncharacterized protein n=1 Tax=Holothuria leucospilota TaxID=206669 RepID=A0A9Q0YAG4_HOLLE|nr:hypothetical protein HOLleu_43670 [Holothuria leucospilota]
MHYIGWPQKYDHWRLSSTVVTIPCAVLEDTPFNNFVYAMRVAIKEKLNRHRREDSLVEILLPIQKSVFEKIAKFRTAGTRTGHFRLTSYQDFKPILGEDWFYRVFNAGGDFCAVVLHTLDFYLREREPLHEYASLNPSSLGYCIGDTSWF